MIIAGHNFQETPHGRCCVLEDFTTTTPCSKTWLFVRSALRSDIGKPGFSHYGVLYESEYDEIQKEIAREEANFSNAMASAAGPGIL